MHSVTTEYKKAITLIMATIMAFTFAIAKPPTANADVDPQSFFDGFTISDDGNSAMVQDGAWSLRDDNLVLTAGDGTTLVDSPLKGATATGAVDALSATISEDAKTVSLHNTGIDHTYTGDTVQMTKRVIKVDELIRRYQQYLITSMKYDPVPMVVGGIAGVGVANVLTWLIFASIAAPVFVFAMPLWLPLFAVWIFTQFFAGFVGFYIGSTVAGLASPHPEVREDAQAVIDESEHVKDKFVGALTDIFV